MEGVRKLPEASDATGNFVIGFNPNLKLGDISQRYNLENIKWKEEQNENDDSTIIDAPNTILGDGEGKELEKGTCNEECQIIIKELRSEVDELRSEADQHRKIKDREEYIVTNAKIGKAEETMNANVIVLRGIKAGNNICMRHGISSEKRSFWNQNRKAYELERDSYLVGI